MLPIAAIEDTVYAWMPRWFLLMMLVSSAGSALLFLMAVRLSGKKGYLFLALAAGLPSALFAKDVIERKVQEARLRQELGVQYFGYQGGASPEIPWMSALTLVGAIMIYRAEKRANKAPEPTPGSVTPRATEGVSK